MKSLYIVLFFCLTNISASFGANSFETWYSKGCIKPPAPTLSKNGVSASDMDQIKISEIISLLNFQLNTEYSFWSEEVKAQMNSLIYNKNLEIEVSNSATSSNEMRSLHYDDMKVVVPAQDFIKDGSVDHSLIAKKLFLTFRHYSAALHEGGLTDDNYKALQHHVSSSFKTELYEDEKNFEIMRNYIDDYYQYSIHNAFSGEWSTSYGDMILKQNNDSSNPSSVIAGNYGGNSAKKIIGELNSSDFGLEFKGAWIRVDRQLSRPVEFTLSDDYMSFSGYWINADQKKVPWVGKRVLRDDEKFLGTWNYNGQDLVIFAVDKDLVKGYVKGRDNYLEGALVDSDDSDEQVINGQWNENGTDFIFQLTFDMDKENVIELKVKEEQSQEDWKKLKLERSK